MATIGTTSRIGRLSFIAENRLVMQIASLEVRQMIKPASLRVRRNGIVTVTGSSLPPGGG
jgi:hypothetical protein